MTLVFTGFLSEFRNSPDKNALYIQKFLVQICDRSGPSAILCDLLPLDQELHRLMKTHCVHSLSVPS